MNLAYKKFPDICPRTCLEKDASSKESDIVTRISELYSIGWNHHFILLHLFEVLDVMIRRRQTKQKSQANSLIKLVGHWFLLSFHLNQTLYNCFWCTINRWGFSCQNKSTFITTSFRSSHLMRVQDSSNISISLWSGQSFCSTISWSFRLRKRRTMQQRFRV